MSESIWTQRRCRYCGKDVVIMHPNLWAYKKGNPMHWEYYCSWKCLRAAEERNKDKKGVKKVEYKYQRRDRREVLTGLIKAYQDERYSPVDYMKEEGYKRPTEEWQNLRIWARKKAPEMYQKLVELKLAPKVGAYAENKATVETAKTLPDDGDPEPAVTLVYDESIAEEYRREQAEKEAEKAEKEKKVVWDAVKFGECEVTAIRHPELGEFHYDKKHGHIEWRTDVGDEVCTFRQDWVKLAKLLPKILRILGADAE